ncbi:Organic cation transporter protein, partial [Eumeta japonica]
RNWVCERAGLAPLAQSLYFVGSIIGGVVFGLIADRSGRVPALIGSCVVGCVGSVASAFTRGFLDFALCRFIVGFSYDSCFMLLYILVLEYTGPRHRSLVANLSIALFFGAACLALPWLALWIADWRMLLVCTALPGLIVIAAPWFLPESARWLLSRGRVNKAIDILHRFEKINKTKIPEDILEDFIASSRQTDNANEGIRDLVKSGPLRLAALYMTLMYMSLALVFDGLVRMSETLGLNFFITFTLASAT